MKIASHAETETMAAVYATHFGVVSRRLDGRTAVGAATVRHFDFDRPVAVHAACQKEAS